MREMAKLFASRHQLKMIGLNINGIYKKVNFKEELKSEDFINLQNYTKEVNEKINLITQLSHIKPNCFLV